MAGERFMLGVNYWPRRKAMYWWDDFDIVEVADDLDVISSLGMDVVRIFLLWDDWQATPDSVDARRLADLGSVLDAAAARGLQLDVTFFTGHMSGPNWSPRWLLDPAAHPPPRQLVSGGEIVAGSYRNMFTDPAALEAQRVLLRAVVGAYAEHEAVWLWNLGNEPDLFAQPPTASAGGRWVKDMVDLIHQIDPDHPVTCGLHTASLFEHNGLRVDDVFAETDVAVMHGYPMYTPWARHPLDPDFVPFLCALTAALAGKPVLAEEWGGCTVPGESTTWTWTPSKGAARTQFMAGEDEFAEYVGAVLPRLVEVGATGAMLWCFADYHEDLWDRPPCDDARHERHFGLVRPDGSLKPHAEVVRRFSATDPVVTTPVASVDVDVSGYYADPAGHARHAYLDYVENRAVGWDGG
jgi:endo-1,4-beta-mannosidase